MGQVIAIAAGKDGAGKTTVAVNLAVTLARGGAKVALVDMVRGMRGLDLALGLECDVVYDLGDVLRKDCTLGQAAVQDDRLETLTLFSCSQSLRKSAPTKAEIRGLYDAMREAFDFVLVELPGGPTEEMILASSGVDCALLVTNRNREALRNLETVSTMLRTEGVEKRFLLINQVRMELFDSEAFEKPDALVERLRLPLLAMLPYDENILLASATGMPVALEENYVTDTFRRLAQGLIQANL